MTRLSVVVPAFDEAERLTPSLEAIQAYLVATPRWLPAEVVVVDDGSVDATAATVRHFSGGAELRFELLSHPFNRGKGAAVRTGFAASQGEAVLLSDADLATPIEELERLSAAVGGSAVAIGSRAIDRGLIEVRQPRYRDLMGRAFNLGVRVLALPGVHDTQCGFKLFPGVLARALAGAQRIDGFAFDVELLLLARRWGWTVREVPVRWRHVEASRVAAVRHSSEMLFDLLGLVIRRGLGRLPPAPPFARGAARER